MLMPTCSQESEFILPLLITKFSQQNAVILHTFSNYQEDISLFPLPKGVLHTNGDNYSYNFTASRR